MNDIVYVDVVAIKALPDFHLWVRFSNGREGVRDFRPLLAGGGPMAQQLRDGPLFNRVYVNDGVPAWPNGYEVDATNLHLKMLEEGLLSTSEAAE